MTPFFVISSRCRANGLVVMYSRTDHQLGTTGLLTYKIEFEYLLLFNFRSNTSKNNV